MSPNPLLVKFSPLLMGKNLEGPILDLACGKGQNGLFLAGLNLPVILADRSAEALKEAQRTAKENGLNAQFWEVDLETGSNPLKVDYYRAILVFRYLHRPLLPCLKKGIRGGGILIYETFTIDQPRYGRPHNPDYLLKHGELAGEFKDWHILHYYEGIIESPQRAMAQIVCRKPV
ncbi:methyltransferase domain-containing protein [Syntrophus aciditrophicus]|uniref:SAM-dependent methyltransferase n=1 Tax=Syntrophus aciditrophicus (strain SB) TaxID=56780 RepID=Q2LU83_SYNAS|nr:methyltransferase domain-containing protein [Syntrophus aciditrophicus]ABC77642.1 SAM-dependent methyltransferase [Syntrophus aciditrophicus SB]